MAKPDPQRLIFGIYLLVLIVVGEVILDHFNLPAWPAFMIMILFFIEHSNIKKAPEILAGGCLGIVCIILIKYFIGTLAPVIGQESAKILFIVVVVYAIVAFKEIVPILLNDYTFMFFTVSALAIKMPESNPLVWISVELIGGGIFIAGIIGIFKIMEATAPQKAVSSE